MRAFEAVGRAVTIEAAYECTGRGGTTVVVGQVADGVRVQIDPFVLSDQEKKLVGSNYGSCRPSLDFVRIIDMHMTGRLDLSRFISMRLELENVNDALDEMVAGRGLRSVITF